MKMKIKVWRGSYYQLFKIIIWRARSYAELNILPNNLSCAGLGLFGGAYLLSSFKIIYQDLLADYLLSTSGSIFIIHERY